MNRSSIVDPLEFMIRSLWFDLLFDELDEDLYLGLLAGNRFQLSE